MSDTSYPTFQHYGTNAQRLAFTPSPGASQPIYMWYETDTGSTYLYDTSWHQLTSGGVSGLTRIGETVTSGSQATVTFSSIPTTWRDLIISVRGRSNEAALTTFVLLTLNNDSGANYDEEDIYMLGVTNGTSNITEGLAQTSIGKAFIPGATATASVAGSVEYTVLDYKGTTFQKALRYELATKWGTSTGTVARGLGSAFYRSASAVSRVDVNLGGGNTFVNNSVVSLYGRL